MKTRLKAKKEEKAPIFPVLHGPCRVHIELDKGEISKILSLLTEPALSAQLQNLPPQVNARLLI